MITRRFSGFFLACDHDHASFFRGFFAGVIMITRHFFRVFLGCDHDHTSFFRGFFEGVIMITRRFFQRFLLILMIWGVRGMFYFGFVSRKAYLASPQSNIIILLCGFSGVFSF